MQRRFLFWSNARSAILSLVLVLMCIGSINVYSASFVSAAAMFGNTAYYFIKYIYYGLGGLLAMYIIGWRINYHFWFKHEKCWAAIMLVVLLCVDAFGATTKGAQRWLSIGGFSFQPSEFVKLGVILIGSGYLGRLWQQGIRPHLLQQKSNLAFWVTAVLAFMVLIQPDMGTAAIIMALMIILYLVAGLPWKQVGVMLGIAAVGVVCAVAVAPYRLSRVVNWLDPWKDPQGNGYQMVQSLIAIGSGGWHGTNLGMGTGKFFFLPEAHTDFAFAIWCQEWGFFFAVALLAIFLLLAYAILQVAKNTTDEAGYLLVTGVNFLVVGQAIANMAMVCGLLPVIGVPLSFISYGGTSLIATLAAVGMVCAVYRDEVRKERLGQSSSQPPTPPRYSKEDQVSQPLRFRPRGWQPK